MHIICTSAWAEWEGPDWLIEYPRGDYTYISVRCDDGSAIAIVYWWYDARSRSRILWCHRRMHRLRCILVGQPWWWWQIVGHISVLGSSMMMFALCHVCITNSGVVVGGKKWPSWLRSFLSCKFWETEKKVGSHHSRYHSHVLFTCILGCKDSCKNHRRTPTL